jgi:MFS transporter, MHS family, shikimate and dehydroshikimate transport protein
MPKNSALRHALQRDVYAGLRTGDSEGGRMEKLAGVDVGQEAPMKKIAFASFIGTAIEFYDFYIYGTAAALVFGGVFFPELSPVSGTLASFATFGVAFLARPLGGAIFGHFGDRVGRKAMLIFSLLVMGLATFFVGLLPGYATIGVAAPVLLVLLRFLQGIGLGGEWGGAVLMAAEHAPPGKRAFYSGFAQVGPPIGFLLSSGAFLLFASVLSEEQFAAWGWRLPFLVSIVLVGVGLFVRISVAETPVFKEVMETETEARVPIVDVFRTYPRTVALAALAGGVMFTFFFVITVFALSYGVGQLGLTQSTMLYCVMVSMVFMSLGIMVFATLSDRLGRRNLSLFSSGFLALWAFPMFWLVDTGNPVLISLSFSVALFAWAAMYGPMGAFFSELFGTRVRYSGASLSYALAGVLGGALAPYISARLLAATGASWSISLYLLAMALVSFVSVLLLLETYQTDISETHSEERQLIAESQNPAAD